jgi:hypothetical protein
MGRNSEAEGHDYWRHAEVEEDETTEGGCRIVLE